MYGINFDYRPLGTDVMLFRSAADKCPVPVSIRIGIFSKSHSFSILIVRRRSEQETATFPAETVEPDGPTSLKRA